MRIALRQGLVGIAVWFGALAPLLACSGTTDIAKGEPTGEDQSLLKEGACFGEALGGDTSCKPADTWKEYAAQACAARGLALSDFGLGAACQDGHADAKYSCCKTPPRPLPPKPGPRPPACFGDAQGGPTSCKPAEVWTKYASDLCVTKGTQIAHIAFAEECGKGTFRYTKYECCDSQPPPPPPPPPCETTVLGGGEGISPNDTRACQPNGVWKERAFDHCRATNRELSDLSVDNACGNDMSSSAKVTCCGGPPEPPRPEPPYPEPPKPEPPAPPFPEPPPPSCIGQGAGSSSCTDLASWKKIANDACASQGLQLAGLESGGNCPNGGATEVKYLCCR